jgi:Haem utilisation ChuX/HutX
MSVSFALPGIPFASIFSGARLADAAALAARCGDDVVRLRPEWPAVIAATRFARRARWRFGNRAATFECAEPRAKRWLSHRAAGDPVQVRFDLSRWSSAYARADERMREIDVFAADGSAIAAVQLDDVEASLDELIWLLVDNDQHHAAPGQRRRINLSRPFSQGALCNALLVAFDEELPIEVRLENAGGAVCWTPRAPVVIERDGCIELRSALGSVTMCDRRDGIWSVNDGAIEARGSDNARWVRVSLASSSAHDLLVWRGICSELAR